MKVAVVTTGPIEGQKPGTPGLGKRVSEFQHPQFVENFVQSLFDKRLAWCNSVRMCTKNSRMRNWLAEKREPAGHHTGPRRECYAVL